MTIIGNDEKAESHATNVCKTGQGSKCCKYLIMAMNGWECMKTDPVDKKLIDDFYSDNTHNANGDNCDGYGVQEAILSAEERMLQMYEEKEKLVSKAYQKALYENPQPLSDEEVQRRNNFWRTNGRYLK